LTTRRTLLLAGRAWDDTTVRSVEISQGASRTTVRTRSNGVWAAHVRLVPGRNVFRIVAEDITGKRSQPVRVIIIRR
jgi:hypothetical protein